jgi:hypothetical protein
MAQPSHPRKRDDVPLRVIASALVLGLLVGMAGGWVERDAAASLLAILVTLVAVVQLVHIWRT